MHARKKYKVHTVYTLYTNNVQLVGSLKMNTALEYSTRVVQEGDRRCKKSILDDLAYLTSLRIPLMNPVNAVLPTAILGSFAT
jgi:hypothetical protein